jgi:hypothetical protein
MDETVTAKGMAGYTTQPNLVDKSKAATDPCVQGFGEETARAVQLADRCA